MPLGRHLGSGANMNKWMIVAALANALLVGQAAAQSYPSRPITLIVPVAAGGPTDTIARLVAGRMSKSLGQPVVVENITGAAGTIGVGHVAQAQPDGYTIGIGFWSTHVINPAIYSLSYNVLTDFAPISLLTTTPQIIVSKNAVPAQSLKELVAWLKANPGTANEGTGGVGSPPHIAGIYFQKLTGTQFRFVPYRGAAPAMRDLLAGQIDLFMPQAFAARLVQAGKIRAYAIMAKTRLQSAPDIPTVDEAGVPGLYISTWHGLWAPKGTPATAIAKLDAAVEDALADAEVRKKLAAQEQEIFPRDQQTPQALATFQKAEIDKWWPIIKEAGVHVE
jgi:tripartite-type tricarboxylate transporter receptor subunit TctC